MVQCNKYYEKTTQYTYSTSSSTSFATRTLLVVKLVLGSTSSFRAMLEGMDGGIGFCVVSFCFISSLRPKGYYRRQVPNTTVSTYSVLNVMVWFVSLFHDSFRFLTTVVLLFSLL